MCIVHRAEDLSNDRCIAEIALIPMYCMHILTTCHASSRHVSDRVTSTNLHAGALDEVFTDTTETAFTSRYAGHVFGKHPDTFDEHSYNPADPSVYTRSHVRLNLRHYFVLMFVSCMLHLKVSQNQPETDFGHRKHCLRS